MQHDSKPDFVKPTVTVLDNGDVTLTARREIILDLLGAAMMMFGQEGTYNRLGNLWAKEVLSAMQEIPGTEGYLTAAIETVNEHQADLSRQLKMEKPSLSLVH